MKGLSQNEHKYPENQIHIIVSKKAYKGPHPYYPKFNGI